MCHSAEKIPAKTGMPDRSSLQVVGFKIFLAPQSQNPTSLPARNMYVKPVHSELKIVQNLNKSTAFKSL